MSTQKSPFVAREVPRVGISEAGSLRKSHFEPGLPCVLAGLYSPPALDAWMTGLANSHERIRCVVARYPDIRLISDAERPGVGEAASHPEAGEFFADLELGEVWTRLTRHGELPPLVQRDEYLYVFSALLPASLPFPRTPPPGELGELLYADPRPRQLLVSAAGLLNRCHAHVHTYLLHQIHGRKKVRLFSPAETPHLYPNAERRTQIPDFDRVDVDRFPLVTGATAYEGVLEPGDALYLPSYWWHEIRVDEPSVSIGFHAPGGAARDAALALHEGIAAALEGAATRAPDAEILSGIAAIVFTAAARDVSADGIEAVMEGLRYRFD